MGILRTLDCHAAALCSRVLRPGRSVAALRPRLLRPGSKQPFLARALSLLLLLALLLPASYIVTHAVHAHDHLGNGGDCSTCEVIAAAAGMIRQAGEGIPAAAASLATLTFCAVATALFCSRQQDSSLLALGVRLNI